jgi:hypothetical protein
MRAKRARPVRDPACRPSYVVAVVSATAMQAKPNTPALGLSVEQACAALSVSWDFWREHIEPDVRIVRVGRRKIVPTTELQKWLDAHAEKVAT